VVAVDAAEPEECDDGNTDDTDACPGSCEAAKCGDGFVLAGTEECDDSGPSDTCDTQCKRAAFWVFVSSVKLSGSAVMGLQAADATCTMLAKNKSIEGSYKAWLGDGGMTAANRLFHAPVRYILPNKSKVADNWNDLSDGSLDLAITRDETGAAVAINPAPTGCMANNAKEAAVWTGALPSGNGAMSCADWTSAQNGTQGQAGLLNRVDMLWSGCQFSCDTQARLYCVEQPPT
jgi:hypothetical protein